MPYESKAQSRLMRWAAAHPAEAQREHGIKPGVAERFIEHSHGQSLRGLPERVEHKAEGGHVDGGYPRPFRW